MKKRVILSFFHWLFMLFILLALIISKSNMFILTVALAWIILPVLSWALNLYNRKHIYIGISMPATASKKKDFQGKVIVKNNGNLSVGCIYCQLYLKNQLTGEKESWWIQLSALARGNTEKDLIFKSDYCGYISIKIEKLFLMDWFGFLPIKKDVELVQNSSIVPDTFSLDVAVSITPAQSNNSDSWSQVRKGKDQTEVFGLREYVPGDSLKQIHWKLSSKLDELIVKEPSLPTEKTLLLFWDKNTGAASAKQMDAMAEVVSSVAQALGNQGIPYKLGWTEGELIVLEDVEQQEQLLPLIPRMIKTGSQNSERSFDYIHGNQEAFGKVIYFAEDILENVSLFTFSEMIMVVCGQQQDNHWRTVNYMADTYIEDLQKIEL